MNLPCQSKQRFSAFVRRKRKRQTAELEWQHCGKQELRHFENVYIQKAACVLMGVAVITWLIGQWEIEREPHPHRIDRSGLRPYLNRITV